MRDYQIAKQNVDTFYANEKNIRAEEELKKKEIYSEVNRQGNHQNIKR